MHYVFVSMYFDKCAAKMHEVSERLRRSFFRKTICVALVHFMWGNKTTAILSLYLLLACFFFACPSSKPKKSNSANTLAFRAPPAPSTAFLSMFFSYLPLKTEVFARLFLCVCGGGGAHVPKTPLFTWPFHDKTHGTLQIPWQRFVQHPYPRKTII